MLDHWVILAHLATLDQPVILAAKVTQVVRVIKEIRELVLDY
jgi:hypothetical protein